MRDEAEQAPHEENYLGQDLEKKGPLKDPQAKVEGTKGEEASLNPQEPTAEEQIVSLKDQLMRQLAEVENLRKRSEREREETTRYAITRFARDLLEVSDNLSRALKAYQAEKSSLAEEETLFKGVTLTHKALLSIFERYHIQLLDPKGEKFNPNLHQAMFEVETEDHDPGTVLDVMQPGYTLYDRLLRPAMVGVSKKKALSSDSPPQEASKVSQ